MIHNNASPINKKKMFQRYTVNKNFWHFWNIPWIGKNLEGLFTQRKTVYDAVCDSSMTITVRQRFKMWWNEVCAEIDNTNLITQG